MSLIPGARIGVYEITAKVGEGGMGEVYRARDTRLGREVALKVVSDSFIHDPAGVARFQREAQLLASLNHPHIATIHGLDEAAGLQFLVMELVEGGTLAERLASGPLPMSEALAIARQIADALQAAHEKGIIHRDLKPANIALTAEGQVKVLDFGLAKLAGPAEGGHYVHPDGRSVRLQPDLTASPTITSPAMMTGAGVILGTAAYMAPEQAKGQPADKRCDIWAFGCVLYEMLTGRRAFDGEDVSDILAAVLRAEPEWDALPADVPPPLRTLLARCLEKHARKRVADIAVALYALDGIAASEGGTGPISAASVIGVAPSADPHFGGRAWFKRRCRDAAPVAGAALAAAAVTAGATLSWRSMPAAPPVVRFELALGEQGLIGTNINRRMLAVSPDGMQIVSATDRMLYLRSIGDVRLRPISGTDITGGIGVPTLLSDPTFSPDGQWIAFKNYDISGSRYVIRKIPSSGGTPVAIADGGGMGLHWSGDTILFGQPGVGIMRVSANGGTPEPIVQVDAKQVAYGPHMLPDGETVLFTLADADAADRDRWDRARIVAQSLRSGERKVLVNGGSDARYVETGHLVYAVRGVVFAVPFDRNTLSVTGGPIPLVEGVRRAENSGTGMAQLALSRAGTLIYQPGPVSLSTGTVISRTDRNGNTTPLKMPAGPYLWPRVSPDGTRIAFGSDDGKEAAIWVYGLSETSAMRRLTFGGRNRFPVWSPDSQHVAFQSDRDGDAGIFWQRADGSGTAERLTTADAGAAHTPESWSPNGDTLLFNVAKGATVSLWTLSLRDKTVAPFPGVESSMPPTAVFSPDGRWIAYSGRPSGTASLVYVQPFPATGAVYQISSSSEDGHHPVWSSDGRELFYIPGPGVQLASVRITTTPGFASSTVAPIVMRFQNDPPVVPARNYDVAPDATFIGLTPGAAPVGDQAAQVVVVLNWFEELKRLVPTD